MRSNNCCSQWLLGAANRGICRLKINGQPLIRSSLSHSNKEISTRAIKSVLPSKWGPTRNARMSFSTHIPRNTEVSDDLIIENAAKFAVQKNEGRRLVELIREDPESVGRQVLQSILPKARVLVNDPRGNSVLVACLDIEDELESNTLLDNDYLGGISHIQTLAASMAIKFALSKFGTVFLKKCLEKGTEEQRRAIIDQLIDPTEANYISAQYALSKTGQMFSETNLVAYLACHKSASHVLESAISKGSKEAISPIQASAASRAMQLALNKSGGHVLERCLDNGSEEQRTAIINQLIHPTEDNLKYLEEVAKPSKGVELHALAVLSSDKYGSFVVKRALEHSTPEQSDEIFDFLISNFVELSKHQIGRYVVQASLREITRDRLDRITEQILKPTGKNCIQLPLNTTQALHLAEDVNGFHVMKSILDESLESEKELLLNQIPTTQEPLRQALLVDIPLEDVVKN